MFYMQYTLYRVFQVLAISLCEYTHDIVGNLIHTLNFIKSNYGILYITVMYFKFMSKCIPPQDRMIFLISCKYIQVYVSIITVIAIT